MVYQIISAAITLSLDNIKVWINEIMAEKRREEIIQDSV